MPNFIGPRKTQSFLHSLFYVYLPAVVLLDSLDSVEDVDLADQNKATSKAKAVPEMTAGELVGTGNACENLTNYRMLCE